MKPVPDTADKLTLRIAGFYFSVEGKAIVRTLRTMDGFQPFLNSPANNEKLLFTFRPARDPYAGETEIFHRFETEGVDCSFFRTPSGYGLSMFPNDGKEPFVWFYDPRTHTIDFQGEADPAVLRFSLWQAFGTAVLELSVTAIHSSAVQYRGRAVLFLGESGTGKSTHTRLWLENIGGATLLNDDSPFLEAGKTGIKAWGSPWSGKTPCYRDEEYPVAAVVRLGQAPENRIRLLKTTEAIGALLPSFPPSFAYEERTSDLLSEILSRIIGQVPVYHLECLPDADAARLSFETIFGK